MTVSDIFFKELSYERHEWNFHNYSDSFDLSSASINDNVQRVDANGLSVEDFIAQYEMSYTPVVLTNCQVDWPAKKKWTLEVSLFEKPVVDIVIMVSLDYYQFENWFHV